MLVSRKKSDNYSIEERREKLIAYNIRVNSNLSHLWYVNVM